jgi:hypothetical protein
LASCNRPISRVVDRLHTELRDHVEAQITAFAGSNFTGAILWKFTSGARFAGKSKCLRYYGADPWYREASATAR